MEESEEPLYWVVRANGTKIAVVSFNDLFLHKFEKGTHYIVSRAEEMRTMRQTQQKAEVLQKVFSG